MGLDDLRAVRRDLSFPALTALVLLLHPALAPLGSAPAAALRRLWCRAVCLLLGIRLERSGEPYHGCATLYVANHVSYLDIPALGAFLDATFVAKAEVAGWPLLGLSARRAGTMFVRRHRRQALIQRNALAARMRAGESFVLSWSVASRKELGRALRQEIERTLIRARTAPAGSVAQVAGAFS